MVTPEVYEQKETELSNQILETMEKFAQKNFDLSPQIMMAALAELLIQFSVGQVGKDETLRLFSHLKESVEMFGDRRSPQH